MKGTEMHIYQLQGNKMAPLTHYQTTKFRLVKTESICRRQNKCNLKTETCFGKGRKHCGKRRKCWLPGFSPFPTMFSKATFSGSLKVGILW